MQRLYSMFPAGQPGIGLLFLRMSACVALFADAGSFGGTTIRSGGAIAVFALVVSLGIGFATPLSAAICCCIELAIAYSAIGPQLLQSAVALLAFAALALIGPGAYSLDAKLFGRRLIVSSKSAPSDDG
jgi:hypothetical protein